MRRVLATRSAWDNPGVPTKLFEFHDQEWFPRVLRDGVTDELQAVLNLGAAYAPVAGRLGRAIQAARTDRVVDLCSGGGGPWSWLQKSIGARTGISIEVRLTDKYPNLGALERARAAAHGAISYSAEPVDARSVPAELEGFRTMFTSVHHLPADDVVAVLQDAVGHGRGIALFDIATRHMLTILMVCLVPLGALLTAAFVRPFRWSRLFWTYLIPVIPFVLWWDGIVSCLRSYSPAQLREMTARLHGAEYTWEIGEESKILGVMPVTYIIGYPT